MSLQPWMLEVNRAGLARVADALAMRIDGEILCASCSTALRSDFSAWHCARCQAQGDALIYAALALGAGQSDAPAGCSWRAVRRTLAERGLCQAA